MKKRSWDGGFGNRCKKWKGGGGSVPAVVTPAPSPAPSPAAKETSADVQAAKEDEKRRKQVQSGYQSTILTGQGGLSAPAATGKKTLLGG